MTTYMNRQHEAFIVEDRQRYDERREQYLRNWAIDVTRSCGNHPEDIQAVREMPLAELQAWYNEAQS